MGESKRRLLVLGFRGMLGTAIMKRAPEEYELVGADRGEVNIGDVSSVKALFRDVKPSQTINCAAFTNVDGCEANFEEADAVNGAAPGFIAAAAAEVGSGLIHISTDYVFDGGADKPYSEDSATGPVSAYGRTKLNGERALAESGLTDWRIVRTSWLYGEGGKNFVDTMAALSLKMPVLRVVADQRGRPTYTEDLADALFLLIDKAPGFYHYSNSGSATWHEFASEVIAMMRLRGAPVVTESVLPISTSEYPRAATPPAYSVMSTDKFTLATGVTPPHWKDALERYFAVYGDKFSK